MMELLRAYGPKILLGLAGLITLALIIYSVRTSDDDEDEDEDDVGGGSTLKMSGSHAADTGEIPETDESRARKSRMIALKDSLERSLQTRAGVKASGLDRLAMPWFMLVGTEGSGKRSLLASTGLPLPYGPPVEVDSARKDAGRWWLFDDAVVVEAPTAKPVPKPVAPSEITAAEPVLQIDTSEGWNNLLHLLRRERPDSPLNGIIVAVSCADLIGTRRKSPEDMAEQAELVRAFLEKTRRVLGVRLPVHLLITKCDVIPGFRSFAETLPEPRRDDIFGWANPAPVERPFDAKWVESGVLELQKSLESLHDELLAAPETIHDADGLFVFVNEFAEIQDPLVDFVTRLMPANERRPSLFFRGVYFTGDASEMAARAASRRDDDATTLHISMEATEAESHSLVFLRSLFADKIFQEAGLARSSARLRISRDRRVVLAQAAAIIIASLGGLGLWSSVYGFERSEGRSGMQSEASELTRVLSGAAIDLDELRRRQTAAADSEFDRRAKDAAVLSLVAEMRAVSPARVRSPFVPTSLLSPLSGDISEAMRLGTQNVLMPVIRARLQERVSALLRTPAQVTAAGGAVLDEADPSALGTYLRDVRALTRNVGLYNRIARPDSGSFADLSPLIDYLFGQRPADSAATSDEFNEALRVAESTPLTVTAAQNAAVIARSAAIVNAITDSSTRQLLLGGSSDPADDIKALRRVHALFQLLDPKTGLTATVGDSTPSGVRIARAVQDSIAFRMNGVAQRLLKDAMLPEQSSQRLRTVVSNLFGLRLMEDTEARQIQGELRAGQKLRWDIGRLELAFALRGELRRALITSNEAFTPQIQARLRAAFESRMRERVITVAAGAQRFTPDTVRRLLDIRSEGENLADASTRLIRLAQLLDTLEASSEGKKLIAAGARQAEHVLALAKQLLDSAGYLTPKPAVVAAWRGGIPIGFAALGVPDTGAFTLALDREQVPAVVTLAHGVAPALNYLRLPGVGPSQILAPKLFDEWSGLVASVARAEAQEPSSIYALRQYLERGMSAIDVPACQAASTRSDEGGRLDWFVVRRQQFRATIVGRCGSTGSAAAITAYQRLRDVFVTKLAGHFPFVDSARAASAPDADPAAVREFYGLYDAFAKLNEVILRSDPRVGAGARSAFVFLDQVARARQFFSPFIDSAAARRSPEYSFVVEPMPAGQGTKLELHTGERVTPVDEQRHEGVWGFGEDVKLLPPNALSTDRPSFMSTGWWGLIELGALQRAVRIRFYHPDTMVELPLPIFPMVAPEIPPARR